MKRISFILAFTFFANLAKAYDFEVGGFYYNILSLSDRTAEVTCQGIESEDENHTATYSGDIVIPKTVEYAGQTFSVTEINPYAFINCKIGTLTIHNGIVNICSTKDDGAAGVGGMYGLFDNLIIEYGETPIQCFRGLVDGDVTNSVYLGRNIDGAQGTNIVYRGGSFKSITFGDKLTELKDVCSDCSNLTEVSIPANIKSLSSTFYGCKNLKKITAPGVEAIYYAFCGSGIEAIDMPNLKRIHDSFGRCTSLKKIDIPTGVAEIGGDVFEGCVNLESVTLPYSLIEFESSRAFVDCISLKDIIVKNPTPIGIEESIFDAMTYLNATLHVPAEALETYKSANVWKNFFNIVGDAPTDDNVCSIIIANSWGGQIFIGDKEIGDEGIFTANRGEKITLKFVSDSSGDYTYEVSAAYVNGKDVSADIANNELTIEVSGNTTIGIDWDSHYVEPDPIYLTIKHADNGCIKMQVDEWDAYKFYIEPAEGWSIHTVMFNEEDITSNISDNGEIELYGLYDNSILSITFQSNSSAVRAVEQSNAKVYAKEGYISITNIGSGEPVQIYNEAGIQVVSTHATSETMNVPLDKGLYIVKLKDATIKVAM